MNFFKKLGIIIIIGLLTGCLVTTGDIRDNRFFVEDDYAIDLLDSDWEVERQKVLVDGSYRRESSPFDIAFQHKKSNGVIGVGSMDLDNVMKDRSLEVHAEDMVAQFQGIKLSERKITIDGVDAIELIISGNYMIKYIYLKTNDRGYFLLYRNTPTYFDEYLGTFDTFVETFKFKTS